MLFGYDGNYEKTLKESITASIQERLAKACDT